MINKNSEKPDNNISNYIAFKDLSIQMILTCKTKSVQFLFTKYKCKITQLSHTFHDVWNFVARYYFIENQNITIHYYSY